MTLTSSHLAAGQHVPRVAVYVRISDDHTHTGLGVERQEEDCRKLATQRGWQVRKVYCDNDRSAYSRQKPRPEYGEMVKAIRNREIDIVLAWHPDRLHRQLRELVPFIDLVDDIGVSVETVRAGIYDLSTPSGRMQAQIAGAVAEHESAHKSERIKRKLEQNASTGKGHGGSRPYGWNNDRTSLNEDEAKHVVWAAEQALAGISMRGVSRGLNERGAKTATNKPWNAVSVRDMLLRHRNAGIRMHHGEETTTPGSWEPILSMEDFRALQSLLLNPDRVTSPGKSGKVHLLSVIARCGKEGCGAAMHTGKGKVYNGKAKPVYRCSKGAHVTRDLANMDRFIRKLILTRMERADIRELMADSASRSTKAKKLASELQAIQDRLNDAAEAYAAGAISISQLTTINTQLKPKLEELQARNIAPDRSHVLGELVKANDPAAVWDAWMPEQRRAAVDLLMTIYVMPMGRRTAWFDPSSVRIEWKR